MPFLKNYKQAMNLLNDIEKGKCSGTCKSTWIRNLKYALKTKTNPLKLTSSGKKNMTKKIKQVSGRQKMKTNITLKKYKTRNSPPFPANDYCNKKKKGNDGKMYISKPNKNNVCSWKLV